MHFVPGTAFVCLSLVCVLTFEHLQRFMLRGVHHSSNTTAATTTTTTTTKTKTTTTTERNRRHGKQQEERRKKKEERRKKKEERRKKRIKEAKTHRSSKCEGNLCMQHFQYKPKGQEKMEAKNHGGEVVYLSHQMLVGSSSLLGGSKRN